MHDGIYKPRQRSLHLKVLVTDIIHLLTVGLVCQSRPSDLDQTFLYPAHYFSNSRVNSVDKINGQVAVYVVS